MQTVIVMTNNMDDLHDKTEVSWSRRQRGAIILAVIALFCIIYGSYRLKQASHQHFPPCRVITQYNLDAKPIHMWIADGRGHKEGSNYVFTISGVSNMVRGPYLISDEPYTNTINKTTK